MCVEENTVSAWPDGFATYSSPRGLSRIIRNSHPRIAFTCGSKQRSDTPAAVEIAGPGLARKKTRKLDYRIFDRADTERFLRISDSKGEGTHYVDLVDGSEIALPGAWLYDAFVVTNALPNLLESTRAETSSLLRLLV